MAHPAILPVDLLTLPSERAKFNFRWGFKSGITKNSVKKTVRESVAEILFDEPRNLLHCGCSRARSDEGRPTSEARSLSEAIESRKFLAVLLSPESFLLLFVGTKSRSRRDSDRKKMLGFRPSVKEDMSFAELFTK
jgi:hypothetical protein